MTVIYRLGVEMEAVTVYNLDWVKLAIVEYDKGNYLTSWSYARDGIDLFTAPKGINWMRQVAEDLRNQGPNLEYISFLRKLVAYLDPEKKKCAPEPFKYDPSKPVKLRLINFG